MRNKWVWLRSLSLSFWLPLLSPLAVGMPAQVMHAQAANQVDSSNLAVQVQLLTRAMEHAQAQLEQSQQQLQQIQQQLSGLRQQMALHGSAGTAPAGRYSAGTDAASGADPQEAQSPEAAALAKAVDDLRERQEMQQAQIAAHEQSKVESESKYPVRITGMLLLNGFVNTRNVDVAPTPTLALPGAGSTGASVRQTVLGINAQGPHVFGARSSAELRVDFSGESQPSSAATPNYAGYYSSNATFLRLRTAHAGLQWAHTEAFFSLDKPLFSPDSPTSLTAVAEPALAWSGNLWTWNPQLGVTRDVPFARSRDLRLQAGLIDVGDAPLPAVTTTAVMQGQAPSLAERSRWPGLEARVALLRSTTPEQGSHIGFGEYFAPHLDPNGHRFNAWAGTLDGRLQLPLAFSLSGSFYRGQALGGLGGGAYKDLTYSVGQTSGSAYYYPLSDVGGWAQLKERVSERFEWNVALGIDDAFASELRRYAEPGGTIYNSLARNQTYTSNVIYSPSTYVLFSIEFRHLVSSPIDGGAAASNVIGLGAGYRF
ncbi:hypothetical protein [Acidipila sp. EB88]|uniref:hypothetical protein n=1 Tax=Acidipila sp. EB88 TaxID=2305226 RepID=UPI001F420BD8|nr:hypothetical protein [Acidipila sp. EB88]